MIIKLKNENVFRRLSVRRSIPPSVWKVINLKVPIFWILIFEEYSLIVFQHIRRKKGRASYWCFLTKERTFREYGTLAEWLRRGPAKAVGYACVSSNLTGVVTFFFNECYRFSFFFSFLKCSFWTTHGIMLTELVSPDGGDWDKNKISNHEAIKEGFALCVTVGTLLLIIQRVQFIHFSFMCMCLKFSWKVPCADDKIR